MLCKNCRLAKKTDSVWRVKRIAKRTFLEVKCDAKKRRINNSQMYQRNAFDMSQAIIVENEMKMDLINIINLLHERMQNK